MLCQKLQESLTAATAETTKAVSELSTANSRIKEIEKISKLTFEEMVAEVQKGVDVDKVISNNISSSKIETERAKANKVTE